MSLRHVYLPLKDVNLRDDVGVLGNLVGELIQDQAGKAVFEHVETTTRAAVHRREGDRSGKKTYAILIGTVHGISQGIQNTD